MRMGINPSIIANTDVSFDNGMGPYFYIGPQFSISVNNSSGMDGGGNFIPLDDLQYLQTRQLLLLMYHQQNVFR